MEDEKRSLELRKRALVLEGKKALKK